MTVKIHVGAKEFAVTIEGDAHELAFEIRRLVALMARGGDDAPAPARDWRDEGLEFGSNGGEMAHGNGRATGGDDDAAGGREPAADPRGPAVEVPSPATGLAAPSADDADGVDGGGGCGGSVGVGEPAGDGVAAGGAVQRAGDDGAPAGGNDGAPAGFVTLGEAARMWAEARQLDGGAALRRNKALQNWVCRGKCEEAIKTDGRWLVPLDWAMAWMPRSKAEQADAARRADEGSRALEMAGVGSAPADGEFVSSRRAAEVSPMERPFAQRLQLIRNSLSQGRVPGAKRGPDGGWLVPLEWARTWVPGARGGRGSRTSEELAAQLERARAARQAPAPSPVSSAASSVAPTAVPVTREPGPVSPTPAAVHFAGEDVKELRRGERPTVERIVAAAAVEFECDEGRVWDASHPTANRWAIYCCKLLEYTDTHVAKKFFLSEQTIREIFAQTAALPHRAGPKGTNPDQHNSGALTRRIIQRARAAAGEGAA